MQQRRRSTDDQPDTVGDNGGGTAELIDQRTELLARLGRAAPEVRSLTNRLDKRLENGLTVRGLDPTDAADRLLAVRLARSEPVNPLRSDADLERRLAPDRRVFVIEHPDLVDRPLNVLWVALCEQLPDRLDQILDVGVAEIDPSGATVAVFYSVWVVEKAFAGIGRASELVAGASAALERSHPHIDLQTTMSPVPGFREWHRIHGTSGAGEPTGNPDLGSACARYLTSLSPEGVPLDPVARFHLGNGARLLRVIPDADDSELGLERAFGLMANYRYAPEDLEANRTLLARGVVPTGEQVAALLDRPATDG